MRAGICDDGHGDEFLVNALVDIVGNHMGLKEEEVAGLVGTSGSYISMFPVKKLVIGTFSYNHHIFIVNDDVECIPAKRFQGNKSLEVVRFRSQTNVQIIGAFSFSESNISQFYCPESVKVIEDGCFSFCRNLHVFVFEGVSHLEVISKNAFASSGLREIQIPSGVKSIGDKCFCGCKGLMRVCFQDPCILVDLSEGLFQDTKLQSVTIPSGVKDIRKFCFSGCSELSEVIFPPSSKLMRIHDCAFEHCRIKSLSFPDSLNILGDKAFRSCCELRDISFGAQLQYIGCECFMFCNSLDTVELPDSVHMIKERAFETLGNCILYMSSQNGDVNDVFNDWVATRSSGCIYVNPLRTVTERIEGSLIFKSVLGSGGEGPHALGKAPEDFFETFGLRRGIEADPRAAVSAERGRFFCRSAVKR